MEDRKPINPDDSNLYLGYDNLGIDKSDTKPFSAKLILVQPKPQEHENEDSPSTDYYPKQADSPKLSTSSDSIEEFDLGDDGPSNIYRIEDLINEEENEETAERITEIIKNENVFEEEVLASDLIKNPDPEFPIHDIRNDLKRFLLTPPPKGVLFRCQINKTNNVDKTLYFTNFIFSLQSFDNAGGAPALDVLMIGYPNRNPKKFSYYIFSDPSEINLNSPYIVGQLKSNFLGTRFNIYSRIDSQISQNSINSNDNDDDQEMNMKDRNHIGVIFYKRSRLMSGKPRHIDVAVPDWDYERENYIDTDLPQERNKLTERKDKQYIEMSNIEPVYDEKQKCYTLNFGGRAQEVSVKNFALEMETGGRKKRVYQFGKCKKHYIVDFTYPICALQAFAIGLSCCHRKLAPE